MRNYCFPRHVRLYIFIFNFFHLWVLCLVSSSVGLFFLPGHRVLWGQSSISCFSGRRSWWMKWLENGPLSFGINEPRQTDLHLLTSAVIECLQVFLMPGINPPCLLHTMWISVTYFWVLSKTQNLTSISDICAGEWGLYKLKIASRHELVK